MPIHAPSDTLEALGNNAQRCNCRSLIKDRFVFIHPEMDDANRLQLGQICSDSVRITNEIRSKWQAVVNDPKAQQSKKQQASQFLDETNDFTERRQSTSVNPLRLAQQTWLPVRAKQPLYARLMSRLMVDLAGGVMENANVLLDRYGLPYIPGSAVKGCARRMALQALHDWIEAQPNKDSNERLAKDDACSPCCEGFETPAHMLAAIARVFGWVEKDWDAGKKDGLFRSDFGWACGEEHEAIWAKTSQHLAQVFGWKHPDEKPWKELRNFAGTIAFLPAHPNADPGLELDVVTPHHTEYYKGNLPTATDTEDPVPVYFPAVKSQRDTDYFTFPLIPLRSATNGDLDHAKNWLAHGLELLGLGAKTNAGYGWFQNVTEEIKREQDRQSQLKRLEEEFVGFETWAEEQKDEAILKLADRKEDCRLWNESTRPSFAAINAYAQSQSLTLL